MNPRLCLFALLLAACGKEAPPPAPKAKAAVGGGAPVAKPVSEKKLPSTPQGKLPQMDPAKAKFIAVPSTPEDAVVKKLEMPKAEIKQAAPPVVEARKAEPPVPEIKKAEPAATPK